MVHNKEVQTEKVAVCWNFVEGHCDFGDKPCWFNHTIDTNMTAVVSNCNLCGKVFKLDHHSKITGRRSMDRQCRNARTQTMEFAYLEMKSAGSSMITT